MKKLKHIPGLLHRAVLRAIRHDCFNLAQSTAYSAIVSIFPALIVAAAAVSLLPYTTPLRSQIAGIFTHILPANVSLLFESYFVTSPHNPTSKHVLIIALLVSVSGASSVIATLMEGVRRANDLPSNCWNFFQRRLRALILVPLSLVPFVAASALIVFGHLITEWIALQAMPFSRPTIFILSSVIRWTAALTASVAIVDVIYHLGTPMRQHWKRVIPGAVVATLMWFIATITFGWYVTRFANYSRVYGSLGAGIALLFWLYIISFSVLCGAEFNTEFAARFLNSPAKDSTASAPNTASHG